jgi:hypothetical protein
MSVAEIQKTKSNLIGWIEQLSAQKMLNVLENLRVSRSNNDWWGDMSDSQKQHINEGLDDAENGRVISSEEFWNNLKNG